MNKALYFVTFATGALVGSLVTWQIAKKNYEKIIQEEIKSVKETYDRVFPCAKEEEQNECEEDIEDIDTVEATKIVYANEYSNDDHNEDIYIITPEAFGENQDYKLVSLTYFDDGHLVDTAGNLVNIAKTVSEYALTTFGTYEDDCVHVRNDKLKTDYEILLDPRNYMEVFKNRG
jgi:hypothetical protein